MDRETDHDELNRSKRDKTTTTTTTTTAEFDNQQRDLSNKPSQLPRRKWDQRPSDPRRGIRAISPEILG